MGVRYIVTILMTVSSLLAVLLLSNPIACSSSSPDGTGGTRYAVSNLGQDIDLEAGVTHEISYRVDFDVESHGGPFSYLRMDLQAHLPFLGISVPGVVASQPPFPINHIKSAIATVDGGQLYVRIARAEQEASVCTDGELYGPFDISLADNFQPASVTPSTADATQQTLDIINIGSYAVCIQIVSAITAIADLDAIIIDMGPCTETPASIAGRWVGTYICTGLCPESGSIDLVIDQDENDPAIASYTDDTGAIYEGRVCGKRFSYSGGVASSYDESGTFVLNDDGTATKTSTYLSINTAGPICSGSCTDELTRLVE